MDAQRSFFAAARQLAALKPASETREGRAGLVGRWGKSLGKPSLQMDGVENNIYVCVCVCMYIYIYMYACVCELIPW